MAKNSDPLWTTDPDDLPAEGGAYVLLLDIPDSTELPTRFGFKLDGGLYAYAGNAWGPGGLRARCRRHLRKSKRRHWHIDWLSMAATKISVAAFPGAGECDLLSYLLTQGAEIPVRGFGSSDCRRCPSHLAALPTGKNTGDIVRSLENFFWGEWSFISPGRDETTPETYHPDPHPGQKRTQPVSTKSLI